MSEKVFKTINLRIKYVESQSNFIPDEIRENLCAGEVIRQLGHQIEKSEIPKGKGEIYLGNKIEYDLTID